MPFKSAGKRFVKWQSSIRVQNVAIVVMINATKPLNFII